jgi:hypothetical protein
VRNVAGRARAGDHVGADDAMLDHRLADALGRDAAEYDATAKAALDLDGER